MTSVFAEVYVLFRKNSLKSWFRFIKPNEKKTLIFVNLKYQHLVILFHDALKTKKEKVVEIAKTWNLGKSNCHACISYLTVRVSVVAIW